MVLYKINEINDDIISIFLLVECLQTRCTYIICKNFKESR